MWARDADSGQAVWFYQMSPHDLFDWDGVNEDILLDLPWHGAMRKVLVRPDRNGYMYVIDRLTGQVLSATPYVYTTSTKGVDLNTGALVRIDEKKPEVGKETGEHLPHGTRCKGLAALLISHRARVLSMFLTKTCAWTNNTTTPTISRGHHTSELTTRYYSGPGGNMGEIMAWDPIAGKKVWTIPDKYPDMEWNRCHRR